MLDRALLKYEDAKAYLISRRHGLDKVVDDAMTIPGWVDGAAAREVAIRSFRLPENPVIVEVGAFMGRSTALMAGARKLRGNGKVFAIDPFDCSGDDFSIPHYERELETSDASSLESAYRAHIRRLGLTAWVDVFKGTSSEAVARWDRSIDLLLLDGDQTPHVARESYELWTPYLKVGGQLIMHNTGERDYAEGHDGSNILANQEILPPKYYARRIIQYSLFANNAVRSGPNSVPRATRSS